MLIAINILVVIVVVIVVIMVIVINSMRNNRRNSDTKSRQAAKSNTFLAQRKTLFEASLHLLANQARNDGFHLSSELLRSFVNCLLWPSPWLSGHSFFL